MPTIPAVLRLRRFVIEEIIWESVNVYTLVLIPEQVEDAFDFIAGQWVYLHPLNEDGSSWGKAAFSIASAPASQPGRIELCIEIKGELTRRASKLGVGHVVGLQGPFGVFTVRSTDEAPFLFLAAGIGITPLRSMIEQLLAQGSEQPIHLLYSSREIESFVYWERFEMLRQRYPSFHPTCTLTGSVPAVWKDEHGRINGAMLDRWLPAVSHATFFMCGPEAFMQDMQRLLVERGIDTKKQIRRESFGS